ncbi:MAG: molybdopterin-binding protein [Ardenticatenales bacterium]
MAAGAPTAELLTIGDEILLGETLDTNGRDLARALRAVGVAVVRMTSVGDDVAVIAAAVREAAGRAGIVITTGGLGPTFDDPTRDAVAAAAGVATEFVPGLWEHIMAYFAGRGRTPTDNNKAQAYIPHGAEIIPNPVGSAPAFAVTIGGAYVICLPGVPHEMHHLVEHAVLPLLRRRFGLSERLFVRTLHCSGAGESAIDDAIGAAVAAVPPDGPLRVGLAAHQGSVDVRLTARAADRAGADALLGPLEAALRERLGGWVVGVEDGER